MYALAFESNVWEFAVRPESLEVTYPARTNATPTLTAAYLDHFGPGIGAVSISGTTGWGKRPGLKDGRAELRRLITLYTNYLRSAAAADDPESIQLTFADGYTGASFLCAPDSSGLRTQQSKGSPLLVRFSLTLIILRDLTGGRVSNDSIGVGVIRSGLGAAIQGAISVGYAEAARALLGRSAALAPTPQLYTVANGDSLGSIAQVYGVDPATLAQQNGVRYGQRLLSGTILTIPTEANTYAGNRQ
jgi:hypothetical protein